MTYIKPKLLGNRVRVTGRDAFVYYRDKALHRDKKMFNEAKHHAKIINAIYEKVRTYGIEYEGGVYAKKFFYFIPQEDPKKHKAVEIFDKGGEKTRVSMNLHTEGKVYYLLFINLIPNTRKRAWTMTNAIYSKTRKMFSDFLFEYNPKYTFTLSTLRKLI